MCIRAVKLTGSVAAVTDSVAAAADLMLTLRRAATGVLTLVDLMLTLTCC